MDFIYFTWFHFFAVKLVASSDVQKKKKGYWSLQPLFASALPRWSTRHIFSRVSLSSVQISDAKQVIAALSQIFTFQSGLYSFKLNPSSTWFLFPLALYAKLKLLRFNLLSWGPKIQKRGIIDWFCSCARLASTKAWKRQNFRTEPATTPANQFFRTHATVSEKL